MPRGLGQGLAMTVAVEEPVPRPLLRLLRRAVLDLARSERRRRFPPTLHVGVPGGTQQRFDTAGENLDHALRVDIVEAMIRRLARSPGPPLVWLTRPGPLEREDTDHGWLAAVLAASRELEVTTRFVLVCRTAWVDPVSGVGRTWARPPRQRS